VGKLYILGYIKHRKNKNPKHKCSTG